MGLPKTRSLRLVLLLAVILPLQSFAGVHCAPANAVAVAAHQHCGDPPAASHALDVMQHHHCGSCCATAIAAMPIPVTPPPAANPVIALPAHRPLLNVVLDRLDRPPRLVTR